MGEHIVTVVDTRSAAMGAGFAVLAAARSAAAGVGADAVAKTAREIAAATRTFFVVDTLEYLRRGGRIGSAAAVLGSALAVKPVLHVQDGKVVPLEKVRTTARALNRLVQRAVEAAGDGPVSVAVHHLAAAEKAERLAAELRERLPDLRELHVSELGAAIGAHVGPGAVGIVVAPFWQEPDRGAERSGGSGRRPGMGGDCPAAAVARLTVHSRTWIHRSSARTAARRGRLPSVPTVRLSSRRSDDADIIRARLRALLAENDGPEGGCPTTTSRGTRRGGCLVPEDDWLGRARGRTSPTPGCRPGIGRHRAPGRAVRWDPGRPGARSLWVAGLSLPCSWSAGPG